MQWLAEVLRKRVCEAVAEVQPGFVSALPKIEKACRAKWPCSTLTGSMSIAARRKKASACLMPSARAAFR